MDDLSTRLESVTFTGDMPKLKKIGDYWLSGWSGCKNLKHIDISGFIAVEEIGGGWLSDCYSLESVTFTGGMPRLKKIGNYWLSRCSKLRHVDLTGFPALEEVGDDWMSNSETESITFTGDLLKLKKVGDDWLSRCSKLKHIDLCGCNALEEIGRGWLSRCS